MKSKKLLIKIFEKTLNLAHRWKYYRRGFCTVVEELEKGSMETKKFRSSIRRLKYLKKCFNILQRGIGTSATEYRGPGANLKMFPQLFPFWDCFLVLLPIDWAIVAW